MFEIGMTLMSVMALRNCMVCYKDGELIEPEMNKMLERCARMYSGKIVEVLHSMVKVDPKQRYSLDGLEDALRGLQEDDKSENIITISQL